MRFRPRRIHLAPAGAAGAPTALPRSLTSSARSILASTAWTGTALPLSYSCTTCARSLMRLASSAWLHPFATRAFWIAPRTSAPTRPSPAGSVDSSSFRAAPPPRRRLVRARCRLPHRLHRRPRPHRLVHRPRRLEVRRLRLRPPQHHRLPVLRDVAAQPPRRHCSLPSPPSLPRSSCVRDFDDEEVGEGGGIYRKVGFGKVQEAIGCSGRFREGWFRCFWAVDLSCMGESGGCGWAHGNLVATERILGSNKLLATGPPSPGNLVVTPVLPPSFKKRT